MNTFLSETDVLYSPSRWSKRFNANIIFEKHLEIITNYSEDVKKYIKFDLNIPYGSGKREVIDIYGTDLANGVPIFIHVHGGYWQEEAVTQNNNSFIAKCLHANRIKSIFIGYELCPKVTIQDISKNLEIALQKCLEYAKKQRSRALHLSGHSAGAHLIATLFQSFIPSLPKEDQKLFKTAFLLCGLYDLRSLTETQANHVLKLDEDSSKAASPIYHTLAATGTIFYIVTAQNDSPIFIKQSKQFNNHLLNLGLVSKYIHIEEVDHYEIIEKLIEEDFELTQLILRAIL